jgi:hypothetical protein
VTQEALNLTQIGSTPAQLGREAMPELVSSAFDPQSPFDETPKHFGYPFVR